MSLVKMVIFIMPLRRSVVFYIWFVAFIRGSEENPMPDYEKLMLEKDGHQVIFTVSTSPR